MGCRPQAGDGAERRGEPNIPKERMREMRKRGLMLVMVSLLVGIVALVSCGKREAGKCPVCGMHVQLPDDVQGVKLDTGGGEAKYYCSMAHAKAFESGNTVLVVDYKGKKMIDALSATYVLGSKLKAATSGVSRSVVAFSSLGNAQTFNKEQGGSLLTYRGLMSANLAEPARK